MALEFLDDVSDKLGGYVDIYRQISEINLEKRIAKAAISLQSAGLPTYPMDAQAKAGAYSTGAEPQDNGMMMGVLLVGAVALFLILKD